jgi:chlorophyll synthase
MWAYACGVISSGIDITPNLGLIILGIALAGPIVCGMSQAANDWCDRHVDAINQPDRPIPSGRIPGLWGLWIAISMSALALVIGWQIGVWAFYATIIGVTAAWAYSCEPIRLKKSGWWGPGIVALCYEGLPWFTGAAVMTQTFPNLNIVLIAALYAIGAHGIMTLNDFKALKGDRQTGINSLPVKFGPHKAAKIACWVMITPQVLVVMLMANWGAFANALVISCLLIGQFVAMRKLLKDPLKFAPWYNATGVLMFVLGMMVCAFGLRNLGAF